MTGRIQARENRSHGCCSKLLQAAVVGGAGLRSRCILHWAAAWWGLEHYDCLCTSNLIVQRSTLLCFAKFSLDPSLLFSVLPFSSILRYFHFQNDCTCIFSLRAVLQLLELAFVGMHGKLYVLGMCLQGQPLARPNRCRMGKSNLIPWFGAMLKHNFCYKVRSGWKYLAWLYPTWPLSPSLLYFPNSLLIFPGMI